MAAFTRTLDRDDPESRAHHPGWWLKSGLLQFSTVLTGIVVSLTFRRPNPLGGGQGMMFAMLVLAVIFKVIIEFFPAKSQRRKYQKQNHNKGA